jgi:hypothetical protein
VAVLVEVNPVTQAAELAVLAVALGGLVERVLRQRVKVTRAAHLITELI